MCVSSSASHAGKDPQKLNKKKQPRKITLRYLRHAGLFYLERYAASTYQFERAMRRKIERSLKFHGCPEMEECTAWLQEIVQEFQVSGYLNDELYLRGMVRTLRFHKGFSRRMIIYKLKDKGFADHQVLPVLQELETQEGMHIHADEHMDTEMRAADIFCRRKKIGRYHPHPPRKTYEQQLGILARAGFSYDICKTALEGGAFSE